MVDFMREVGLTMFVLSGTLSGLGMIVVSTIFLLRRAEQAHTDFGTWAWVMASALWLLFASSVLLVALDRFL